MVSRATASARDSRMKITRAQERRASMLRASFNVTTRASTNNCVLLFARKCFAVDPRSSSYGVLSHASY